MVTPRQHFYIRRDYKRDLSFVLHIKSKICKIYGASLSRKPQVFVYYYYYYFNAGAYPPPPPPTHLVGKDGYRLFQFFFGQVRATHGLSSCLGDINMLLSME